MDYRRSMLIRTPSALALVLVFNCCSNPGGTGGAPGDAGPACPSDLVGTWNMVSVFCGDTDVSQSVNTNGGIANMRIEFRDAGASCRLVSTVSGPTCTEVEEFELLLRDASGTFSVGSLGITNCQPAQCVFNANDAPCLVGDRAGETNPNSLKLDGGNLVMTSQPPGGFCGAAGVATILTYAKS